MRREMPWHRQEELEGQGPGKGQCIIIYRLGISGHCWSLGIYYQLWGTPIHSHSRMRERGRLHSSDMSGLPSFHPGNSLSSKQALWSRVTWGPYSFYVARGVLQIHKLDRKKKPLPLHPRHSLLPFMTFPFPKQLFRTPPTNTIPQLNPQVWLAGFRIVRPVKS